MALKKYDEEQLLKMSMMEVAQIALAEQKTELNFIDLFNKVADLKQYSNTQKDDMLSRFYTDLNLDGRFSTIGENKWGLKRWYKVDETSEKALTESRKKNAEDLVEELSDEEEDYDEDETLEDGLDEVIEDDEGETKEEEVI